MKDTHVLVDGRMVLWWLRRVGAIRQWQYYSLHLRQEKRSNGGGMVGLRRWRALARLGISW